MTVLIVGLGSIALKHINAIKNVYPAFKIYALRSSIDSIKYDGVYDIYSFSQFKGTPDFILISNPTIFHGQTILEALNFNCPIFIEKPVLDSLEFAKEIEAILMKNKVKTYVACNMRFHPALLFFKEFILNNELRINEVNIYCGSYLPNWRPGKDFRTIYSSQKGLGGGVNLDLIHEIDYCTWLFGFPYKCSNIFGSSSSLEIDVYDYAHYVFDYKSFFVNLTLNYYRRDPKRYLEILTNNDTYYIDLINNKITSLISGNVIYESPFNMISTYEKQIYYFVESLKSNVIISNDFNNGINVLKLAINE